MVTDAYELRHGQSDQRRVGYKLYRTADQSLFEGAGLWPVDTQRAVNILRGTGKRKARPDGRLLLVSIPVAISENKLTASLGPRSVRRLQQRGHTIDLLITILSVVTKDLPISPRFTPYDFLSRCKFSNLILVNQMVELYLLTLSRFPLRKKKHKSYLVRIELTTSAIAGVQVTCYTTRATIGGRNLFIWRISEGAGVGYPPRDFPEFAKSHE